MNDSKMKPSPEDDDHFEFLETIMRFQDGSLNPAEVQEFEDAICSDPAKKKLFQQVQVRTAAIHDLFRLDAYGRSGKFQEENVADTKSMPTSPHATNQSFATLFSSGRSDISVSRKLIFASLGFAVASLLIALGLFVRNEVRVDTIAKQDSTSLPKKSNVILTGEVRARFFDQSVLATGTGVELSRDYMLQSGIVKLKFPSGATTIIEGPSIFQVTTENCLVLNTGACSVHAPPGAEGFEVITPVTKVIDRGTRFYVNVQDNNEAEVHVLEGAADLYSTPQSSDDQSSSDFPEAAQKEHADFIQLTDGEAARIGGFHDHTGQKAGFNPQPYRFQLPDRLVSYQASSTVESSVDELISLKVQRNGLLQHYSSEELVPIEVTWFRSDPEPEPNGYLSGTRTPPSRPAEWLEDRNLTTGLINFGGQPLPLDPIPVFDSQSNVDSERPPGLGIRFRNPVVNHAGPDVVLFEVQLYTNPPDGDPFHVYPVSNRTDLNPLTVTKFDLTMNSPSLRELTMLWSHRYPNTAVSLEDLKSYKDSLKVDVSHLHFRVIGVGIDLSEMGYAEGEQVEELFFQHAASGTASKVDPVFIAGLPPLSPNN
ncbi:FecR domain-containing protein [Rubinisphaera italica]|uniref:FecR protein n=1 Tax=Rubinisphaera italica TaxID=2527969 RepID=A0A5C5XCF7_9PLAN|nr:FecR domain-containing protein [Rubinisphaera italica]TWT60289.1 FecR protein [Rubinisphaera italica]